MGLSAELMRQLGPAVVGKKLQDRTQRDGECLIYTGPRDDRGRGLLWLADKRPVHAHRAAYFVANGSIPDGACVCHSCDRPLCVEPDHLWLGTQQDNLADMRRKGRGVVPPRVNGRFVRVKT